MHPDSFLALAWTSRASPFAIKSSSSSSSPGGDSKTWTPFDMPPPYDGPLSLSSSDTRATSTAVVAAPPTPQPVMSLSVRRSAPSPAPLSTPPPYCASPALVPIPVLGSSAGARAAQEDEEDEDEDGYLALATPAQRSYFVTLSDMFEAAAQNSGRGEGGSPVVGGGEKDAAGRAGVPVLPRRRAGEPVATGREPGCFSGCAIS